MSILSQVVVDDGMLEVRLGFLVFGLYCIGGLEVCVYVCALE